MAAKHRQRVKKMGRHLLHPSTHFPPAPPPALPLTEPTFPPPPPPLPRPPPGPPRPLCAPLDSPPLTGAPPLCRLIGLSPRSFLVSTEILIGAGSPGMSIQIPPSPPKGWGREVRMAFFADSRVVNSRNAQARLRTTSISLIAPKRVVRVEVRRAWETSSVTPCLREMGEPDERGAEMMFHLDEDLGVVHGLGVHVQRVTFSGAMRMLSSPTARTRAVRVRSRRGLGATGWRRGNRRGRHLGRPSHIRSDSRTPLLRVLRSQVGPSLGS
jgi:hypothetical protein